MFVTFHQINCGLPLPSQEDVGGVGCDVLTCRASQCLAACEAWRGHCSPSWAAWAGPVLLTQRNQYGTLRQEAQAARGHSRGNINQRFKARAAPPVWNVTSSDCTDYTVLCIRHSFLSTATSRRHVISSKFDFFFQKKIVGPWIEKSRFIRISATGFLVMDGQLQSCAVAPRSWSTADNPAVISCH